MRIKRGTTKHAKHKKIIKLAKGYRTSYNNLYKRAHEAVMHAGQYNFNHRRHRHGQMRTGWIKIISAGLVGTGMTYKELVGKMKSNNIQLDRKILAEIIATNPSHFKFLTEQLS